VGVGSVLIDQQLERKMSYIGLVGIAFAFFAALSIAITFSAKASGGHINPAVTLSLWLAKQIPLLPAGLYILVQLLNASKEKLRNSISFCHSVSGYKYLP
jgi:glycerol uptake facilitator-like aquaporin